MYTPCGRFRRTAAERGDQQLAWNRSDQAFFAAGACHVLAFAFLEVHADLALTALRKVGEPHAFHVYASDGTWAFDHDGWTSEPELIAVTTADESPALLETLPVRTDIATFCRKHWSRRPEDFAHDPWPRARAYLQRFPEAPPEIRGGSPAP